jgi:pyruvate/2-oxoglutarate dehydrogenase complex dihydrolipoamide acyltransferase (E2) component
MPVEVRVPVLGESVVEATVGAWLKHEGEAVEAGEPIVQLETEKVNVDVSADQAGVLSALAAHEGDTVHPGDVLATIDESVQKTAAPPPTREAPAQTTAAEIARPHASPVARRMAEEHGLDLTRIQGTGTGPARMWSASSNPRLAARQSRKCQRRRRSMAIVPRHACACHAVARPSPVACSKRSAPRPCSPRSTRSI